VTRAAVYGSAAWRAWKHDHHWATTPPSGDPLGAGNTALLSNLAVTPLAFYDVRKNLTLNGSNVSSLGDVSGAGTYGPALVQATSGNQPPWDGTTINFSGGAGGDYLLAGSTVAGLDLSTHLTMVLVADIQSTTTGAFAAVVGAAAAGNPQWRIDTLTGPVIGVNDQSTSKASTVAPGSGNIRLIISNVNVVATGSVGIEIPNTAFVFSGSSTAMAAGNQFIAIGAATSGSAPCALRLRAFLAWAGTYTTAQRDTLKTWATTYHSAVLA